MITIYGHSMRVSFVRIKSMVLGHCILLMEINLVGAFLMILFKVLGIFIDQKITKL